MKITYILATILIFSAFALALDLSIGLLDAVATAGQTNVSMNVPMDNDEPVAIFQFTVNHSSYLIFRGIAPTSRMQNATIEYNSLSPTSSMVAVFVPSNISIGTGSIMALRFDVNSSAAPGFYDVTMSNLIILNSDEILEYDTENGLIVIV